MLIDRVPSISGDVTVLTWSYSIMSDTYLKRNNDLEEKVLSPICAYELSFLLNLEALQVQAW